MPSWAGLHPAPGRSITSVPAGVPGLLHRVGLWFSRVSCWRQQQGRSAVRPVWRSERWPLCPVFALPGGGAWPFAWVGAGNEPASPLSLGFAGSTLSYPIRPQANGRPPSLATLQVLLLLLLSSPHGMMDSGVCTSFIQAYKCLSFIKCLRCV